MKCIIYRCSKKQEMYLYVPYLDDEEAVKNQLPEELLKLTGRIEKVMELDLTERTLARVDRDVVIDALSKKGFYLQMPPSHVLQNDSTVLDDSSDTF